MLRDLVRLYPGLPVKPGEVALDYLEGKGASVCVQLNEGRVIKTFIDGGRVWMQPFTVVYRTKSIKSDEDKVRMIGFLNGLGEWLSTLGPKDLPPRTVGGMGQLGLASVYEQDNVVLGYAATYGFEYEAN